MTTRTAYIISAVMVVVALVFGCMNAVKPLDTDSTLIECGINPINGAYLGK